MHSQSSPHQEEMFQLLLRPTNTFEIVQLTSEIDGRSHLMEATLSSISEQLPGWSFRQYVANEHNLPIRKLGLRCVPSVAVLLDGVPVAQFAELISRKKLLEFIRDLDTARRLASTFSK